MRRPSIAEPLRLARVRRQPGRAHHGGYRAAARSSGSTPQLRSAPARSCSRRARRISRASRETYAQAERRRRGRAVLRRSAGADRGEPSGRLALRRLDRRRAGGDRPAGHPGAAAARARPGPGRQCRRAGKRRAARIRLPPERVHAGAAWRPRSRALASDAAKARSNGRRRPLAGRGRRRRAARRSGVADDGWPRQPRKGDRAA